MPTPSRAQPESLVDGPSDFIHRRASPCPVVLSYLQRGKWQGWVGFRPMAYKHEDIIYVLTKRDVEIAAEGIGVGRLTDEHYRRTQKYIEGLCGSGVYTWHDAIVDALKAVEDERRGAQEH